MTVRVAPSILSADFAALAAAIDRVASETDILHVDVMDGHFVPNLTIGPPVVAAIDRHTDLELDCHLMMTNPGQYLEAFRDAGADGCTVHVEIGGTAALITRMRELGLRVGLAASPDTPFDAFAPFLGDIDLMLLMTVFPGFGGQRFMPEVLPKIQETADAIRDGGHDTVIEVDGGIDEATIEQVAAAGASVFVAGSAVFGASDPGGETRRLGGLAEAARAHSPGVTGTPAPTGTPGHSGPRAKVLTVSDGVVAGKRQDGSGLALVEALSRAGWRVVEHRAVPDGAEPVAAALRDLTAGFAGLVVTTGGTGFAPRDQTPEGTLSVLQRQAPGLAEAMRLVNPLGRLSRATAGVVDRSIVLNTPGSPAGAVECLGAVLDVLPHALALLAEEPTLH